MLLVVNYSHWLRSKSRLDHLLELTRLVGGANLDQKYLADLDQLPV